MRKFITPLNVLSIIILSLFTYLPLFHSGFFNFHDNTQVVRVYEMGKSLSSGMFPVRWVEGLGYGYGYPIFNFYGPLPYYIGGLFTQLGVDALLSTKLMFITGIVLSGITMYFFVRKLFGEVAGVVCGIAYAYFPYHAVNIFVRGAVGEFFSYAFLPVFLSGVFELLKAEKAKMFTKSTAASILKIGFGLFLVALSHNLTFFMVLLLMFPLTLVIFFLYRGKSVIITGILFGILLGVMLSAFYIFPAFLEMKYTNVSSQVGGGADFRDHFVCIQQYWNSSWGYGGSTKDCLDGLSFKLGKANILLVVFSILMLGITIYRKKWRETEKITFVSLILLFISFALTLNISKIIWESIPYMAYLQYPWRFINFIDFFIVIVIGYLLFRLSEIIRETKSIVVSGFIVVAIVATSFKLFVPQYFVSYPADYYTQPNYIKYSVSKISDEYMPSSFSKPRSIEEVPTKSLVLINAVGSIMPVTEKPGYIKSTFSLKTDGVIHINKAFFPAWHAYENEKEISIVPTHNGMNVSIHKGEGLFELKFQQTIIEVISNMLSLIAFIVLLLAIISPYIQPKKTKKKV